uniref:Serine/threonine-protein phosphatase 1 regulatory subunit 10 n=1 Tax=Gouania willdenowi TaxID=441366 RepID=A0A8C5E766_GOUWI
MVEEPVDHRDILKGIEALLGKDGELRSREGVPKFFSMMKASTKMVSKSMFLNILLQTKSHDVLNRFIRVGGYRLLNSWLTYPETTNNSPLLQLILLTLQKLPLKVDHLKQNNTARLVKQLSKTAETEDMRKLAAQLVDGWMATIYSRSVACSGNAPAEKRKKKEETKVLVWDVKEKNGKDEKKKEKPKEHTPIKPPVLKRPCLDPLDAPPLEKKHKPLNTPTNSAKEIKGQIIPAQRNLEGRSLTFDWFPAAMECTGFLDSLNSAPVSGIKIKKKKTVHWAEEQQLNIYFYFDLDETEKVNVNKIKDFGKAAKRELMMDTQTFKMAHHHSHYTMEEHIPWVPPRPLTLAECLVTPGINSTEKLTQRNQEMGILQEIFLSKESVPDSPHEPDPEPYEPMPPRLIPLDEDLSMPDEGYVEPMGPSSLPGEALLHAGGSKLPPVLANLMENLNNKCSSPQDASSAPNSAVPAVNAQELLSSLMEHGASGDQSTEDLIKQPDFSDKIKQLLGSLQQNQNQNPGGPPLGKHMSCLCPGMNPINNMHMEMPMNGGYPPNNTAPGCPRFNHLPPPYWFPFPAGGGPCIMGPPQGQVWKDNSNGQYLGDDLMRRRGGPHRVGHFHRGGQGRRGIALGFRGHGQVGHRRGHNNMNDKSNRPMCHHFMVKGNCRYESKCAFYHPGVNGPPLHPNFIFNNQHGH